jgi:hypothetical protein
MTFIENARSVGSMAQNGMAGNPVVGPFCIMFQGDSPDVEEPQL